MAVTEHLVRRDNDHSHVLLKGSCCQSSDDIICLHSCHIQCCDSHGLLQIQGQQL